MTHRITLEIARRPMIAAVKATTGDGFDTLERWIGDADLLVIRAGEREPIAVVAVADLQADRSDVGGVSGSEVAESVRTSNPSRGHITHRHRLHF